VDKIAVIVGATGLVGGHLLGLLLDCGRYAKVIALTRRPLAVRHDRLEQRIVDFEKLGEHADCFPTADLFCCLGSTIKKAGSQEAFRQIDYTYPLELGKLAAIHGSAQYLIVTAMGASSESSLFYNRVKGDVERALSELSLPALHIFRPSLLLGDRPESRFGERIGAMVMQGAAFLLQGSLRQYRAIPALHVAKAMLSAASQERIGIHVYKSDEIARIAGEA